MMIIVIVIIIKRISNSKIYYEMEVDVMIATDHDPITLRSYEFQVENLLPTKNYQQTLNFWSEEYC